VGRGDESKQGSAPSSSSSSSSSSLLDVNGELQFVKDLQKPKPEEIQQMHTARLARKLGGVTILRKGAVDIISNGEHAAFCTETGSPRRCGGQGDVLAGSAGLWYAWALQAQKRQHDKPTAKSSAQIDRPPAHPGGITVSPSDDAAVAPSILAAFAASTITRLCAESAFSKQMRSMLTTDILMELGPIMERLFPVNLEEALKPPAAARL